ncbi:hypothetical protein D3C83_135920 [compost metagenome]
MDIPFLGGDVEIAEHREPGEALDFLREPRGERRKPFQFVLVLVGIDALAVRDIDADHAHAFNGGREHALLRIFEARNGGHH